MWRRYGDAVYTLLTLAVFGFETIALGLLSLSFLFVKAAATLVGMTIWRYGYDLQLIYRSTGL